jgi:hypothetical protein
MSALFVSNFVLRVAQAFYTFLSICSKVLACKKAHEIVLYGCELLDACDHFEFYDCSWIFS